MELRVRTDEAAEAEITRFIEKRAANGETTEDEREELWVKSVAAYNRKLREDHRWQRLRYHEAQAKRLHATLRALVDRHEREAARYAAMLGVEPIDEFVASRNGHKRGEV